MRRLLGTLALAAAAWAAEDASKIMRPPDLSAHPSGAVDIVATAPAGRLTLDGKPLAAEQPFPNVFHATIHPAPGEHTLELQWEGGSKQTRFFVGANAPDEFKPFRQHPPLAGVECTQCHGLSSRGRFRFKGGCFDCHTQEQVLAKHPHEAHVLERCGDCHNAHGSTTDALMMLPREAACKLCHGL